MSEAEAHDFHHEGNGNNGGTGKEKVLPFDIDNEILSFAGKGIGDASGIGFQTNGQNDEFNFMKSEIPNEKFEAENPSAFLEKLKASIDPRSLSEHCAEIEKALAHDPDFFFKSSDEEGFDIEVDFAENPDNSGPQDKKHEENESLCFPDTIKPGDNLPLTEAEKTEALQSLYSDTFIPEESDPTKFGTPESDKLPDFDMQIPSVPVTDLSILKDPQQAGLFPADFEEAEIKRRNLFRIISPEEERKKYRRKKRQSRSHSSRKRNRSGPLPSPPPGTNKITIKDFRGQTEEEIEHFADDEFVDYFGDPNWYKEVHSSAKKLNMRINRKRRRGPEPSNSAVYYYRMDVLEEVSEKYPNASPTEVIEIVQNQWNHLDKKHKEQYYRLAQLDQKRFDQEAKQYIPRSEGGTMKRPKRKKHPNAPKHPMSGYLYFVSDNRAKLKKENPDMNFTEIAKLLGKKWKTIDAEKRKEYDRRSSEDKKRYRQEKLIFEPSPVSMETKKRKKHPLAPKHPLSAYLYFVANNRPEFNRRYPNKDFTEIAKLLGEHWKNLPSKEERKYQILAAADKKRYEEEKQKWQPPIERESGFIQMPKKPMTAYSYWAFSERAKSIQENPYIDKKDLTRILRENWNNIPEKEKSIYNEKAELDRQRYQRELAMLPRQYLPKHNVGYKRQKRQERLMHVPAEVLQLSPQEVQTILQCCGVSFETANKFVFSEVNGNNFVQLTASRLRSLLGITDPMEIKKICRIIWILSL